MERAQKERAVASLKDTFKTANTVVILHYRGLNVDETTELRKKARKNGASVTVTKNTLARMAANDTEFDTLSDMFAGPTAIATSEDAVAAAKVVVDFAKDNEKVVIIGGSASGELLDESGVKALAKTPSLDESRAKIVGLLSASASDLVGLLNAPSGQLARVFSARGSQEA